MKKRISKAVSSALAFAIILGTTVCASSDGTEFMFKEEIGTKPSYIITNEKGGTVSIDSTPGTKNQSNALKLVDNDKGDESGAVAVVPFTPVKGTIDFETRFKFSGSMGNFSVIIGGNGKDALKVSVGIDGNFVCESGSGARRFVKTSAVLNNWCTLRVFIDSDKGIFNIKINSETISHLSVIDDISKNGISQATFRTGNGTPTIYIDYVKAKKGNGDESVETIEAPMVDDPIPHPVPDRINVIYNGEYKYFDYEPRMVNDRVLIPLRKVADMFKLNTLWDEEKNIATVLGDGISIIMEPNGNTAEVNGNIIKLDVPALTFEDRIYVPIRFVSENLNSAVDWDNDTQTVIIVREVK